MALVCGDACSSLPLSGNHGKSSGAPVPGEPTFADVIALASSASATCASDEQYKSHPRDTLRNKLRPKQYAKVDQLDNTVDESIGDRRLAAIELEPHVLDVGQRGEQLDALVHAPIVVLPF